MSVLTDDTELNTLFADWTAKTALARIADTACNEAIENVAEARQARVDAAQVARLATQALYDRVFFGPTTTEVQATDFNGLIGSQLRDALDPQTFANKTFQSILDNAMNNGFVPAP